MSEIHRLFKTLRGPLAFIYALWSFVPAYASFSHTHAGGGIAHVHAESVWAALGRGTPPARENAVDAAPSPVQSTAESVYSKDAQDHAAILAFLNTSCGVARVASRAPVRSSVSGSNGTPIFSLASDRHTHERFQHSVPLVAKTSLSFSFASLPAPEFLSKPTYVHQTASVRFLRGPPSLPL